MTVRRWLDSFDNWNTPADWGGGSVPGPNDDAIIAQGGPQVTAGISVHSINILTQLAFHNAGGSSVGTITIGKQGTLGVDASAGDGGSALSVNTGLTNLGTLTIGNATSSGYTTVTLASFVNKGTLTLAASSTKFTYLNVQGTAGFGTAKTLTGSVSLSGPSIIRFLGGGQITTIGAGASLTLQGANAFVADTGATTTNSALTGLKTIGPSATLDLESGASLSATGTVTNYGTLQTDFKAGAGGSQMSVGATLANNGTLQIGNATLSAASTVTTHYLSNHGTILLQGNGSNRALLNVGSSAGFGTYGELSGSVSLYGNSLIEFTAGKIFTIAAGATLSLNGPSAFVADAGSLSSNSALTNLKEIDGSLDLFGGAQIATAYGMTVRGYVSIDTTSGASTNSSLSVGGVLTNSGTINVGLTSRGLSSLSATKIVNSGTLRVGEFSYGHVSISGTAGFGTTGVVTGVVGVYNGSIVFGSGSLTTVAAGAELILSGGTLDIVGQEGTNSALTQLRRNDGYIGIFDESINLGTAFANTGLLYIADSPTFGTFNFSTTSTFTNSGTLIVGVDGEGGKVSVGRLRNSGTIEISRSDQFFASSATLVVNSAAGTGTTGILTGSVSVFDNGVLQFANGQISTIEGSLLIQSDSAFVADAGSTSANSALTGLRTVSGTFDLEDTVTVSTTGGLKNTGTIKIDANDGVGGSTLSIGGLLDNENSLTIGNKTLSAATNVTATSLKNNGDLSVFGNGFDGYQAHLLVSTAAGFGTRGHLTGSVTVYDDALIEFASGQISQIDYGAELVLAGSLARVADTSDTTTNSALHGLKENDGLLQIGYGVTLDLAGDYFNGGYQGTRVDTEDSSGSSTLTVAGKITNQSEFQIGKSDGTLSYSSLVSAAAFANYGDLALYGGFLFDEQALLDIGSAAGFGRTGTVTGDIELHGDAVIQFDSGKITKIDAGATLLLDSSYARIATNNSSTTSALALTEIDGTLDLRNDATTTAGALLTNYGTLDIDGATGTGGASLFSTRFDNEGTIAVGNATLTDYDLLASSGNFLNNGAITLTGNGANHAQMSVFGTLTNNGDITIVSDSQAFVGAIDGSGTIYVQSGSIINFNGAVADTQTITFGGADQLRFANAKTFDATIAGFAVSDVLTLLSFGTGTTASFHENATNQSGVLTVTHGADVAHLNFAGQYATSDFAIMSSSSGTTISHA